MCISLLSIEIKKKYFQKDPRLEVASLSLQTETLYFIFWKKKKKNKQLFFSGHEVLYEFWNSILI